jgi:hypothetical protein
MSNIHQDNRNDDDLSRDLLYGAAEIGKFLGRDRQFVYNKQRHLGIRHVGATLVGSKQQLKKLSAQGN